jgi:hypothetical protein
VTTRRRRGIARAPNGALERRPASPTKPIPNGTSGADGGTSSGPSGAVASCSPTAASSLGCIDPPRRLGFDLWPAPRFPVRSPRRGSPWDRASPSWSTATMPLDAIDDAISIAAQLRDGRRSSNGQALPFERRGSSSRGQARIGVTPSPATPTSPIPITGLGDTHSPNIPPPRAIYRRFEDGLRDGFGRASLAVASVKQSAVCRALGPTRRPHVMTRPNDGFRPVAYRPERHLGAAHRAVDRTLIRNSHQQDYRPGRLGPK